MILDLFRWVVKNIGTLLLALILSLIVWVSAVTADDPNQELEYPNRVPIDVMNLNPDLMIVSPLPDSARVTFNAPQSIHQRLWNDPNSVQAWIDLGGLGPGEHLVPVEVQADERPVRVVSIDPEEVEVTLETKVTETFTVTLLVNGEPLVGYQAGPASFRPETVSVSGPETLVSRVEEVQASISIANATQSISTRAQVEAVDANGVPVPGVTITPENIAVEQPITLLGGYRNVIVRVTLGEGRIADGYRLTNITVTPPNVIVFSSNPELLNSLPGYVETEPIDLTGAQDDQEMYVALNLPEGVSVVGDQRVLVQISIAAIESNIRLSLPVEVTGLLPGQAAKISPAQVDVILYGPVVVLNELDPADITLVVDTEGKPIGIYQEEVTAPVLPPRIELESIQPSTVELNITAAPTPTPTPTPSPEGAAAAVEP